MRITSVNLAELKTLNWKGKEMQTGIFKKPTKNPIHLGPHEVSGDTVSNRKVHGGIDKACYAYGENYYDYWKEKYPNLDWSWGMFGENLTLTDVDESQIFIGDIYAIGDVKVQVSGPRQPCTKFAAKFGSANAIKEFVDFKHPGFYLRVINQGEVKPGDELILEMRNEKAVSISDTYTLIFSRDQSKVNGLLDGAIYDPNLALDTKNEIKRIWKVDA